MCPGEKLRPQSRNVVSILGGNRKLDEVEVAQLHASKKANFVLKTPL